MKLSIIIPTLGRPTLQRVLKGIEECQFFGTISPEILVISDKAIEDDTLQTRFPKVKFLTTGNKLGSSPARNVGIEAATGDILAFIGDDTIPTSSWLVRIVEFHRLFPDSHLGLLGKTSWSPRLEKDPFHRWLEDHAQFRFEQIRREGAKWRNFYTSNISVKREMIGSSRFFERFTGWGFEDIEFGYRLTKKGLRLHYNDLCEVLHDHPQTLEGMCKNYRNARKNAKIFESLHSEVSILPRGRRRLTLKILVWLAGFFPKRQFPQIFWLREWKKAWLGENEKEEKEETEKNQISDFRSHSSSHSSLNVQQHPPDRGPGQASVKKQDQTEFNGGIEEA